MEKSCISFKLNIMKKNSVSDKIYRVLRDIKK